ncbi:bisdemethoxycurcumin synthase [Brachypodium distachyon]|uniref:Chalcone synthase n=1 Tax=Brachypodium distachyon TaxID=15368 RepID=A0A0Q3JPI6_BRADI|nr:bisdemethoxycurcumin synthase [Brachypodium distachyon]KQK13828.1 hypothetical protein BRADI_1g12727v3 [Brachypodium distachyon]|eukprot:XP_014758417.1 bisdemethoxycurcumin synthase [Brachypodium distachyon]
MTASCVASATQQIREAQRADGPASVLAIGTANPAICVRQDEYADYYFRLANAEHLTKLKSKLNRICQSSGIEKRYFHHTEEMLGGHPELTDRKLPSLDTRMRILATAVPELAAAAAGKAIAEWGRPATDITHLVVSTSSGAHVPGADLRVASLLGLAPTVRRAMLYLSACNGGSTALRLAKDMAENNRGARVLVACAELTLVWLRAPDGDADSDTIIMQALFGDGAGAVIVGADPELVQGVERPIFEMLGAWETVIPESEHVATGRLGEDGVVFRPSVELPSLVRANIERCVADALAPLGLSGGDWKDLFWAVHPGGRAILDGVEAELRLGPEKLAASRHVLTEYGNMSGPTVVFVLDEIRRRHDEHAEGRHGLGVMLGIGPGITVETMVLRATGGKFTTK